MLLCSIAGISLILAVLRTLGNPAWVLPLYFVLSYAELFILALAFLFVIIFGVCIVAGDSYEKFHRER